MSQFQEGGGGQRHFDKMLKKTAYSVNWDDIPYSKIRDRGSTADTAYIAFIAFTASTMPKQRNICQHMFLYN